MALHALGSWHTLPDVQGAERRPPARPEGQGGSEVVSPHRGLELARTEAGSPHEPVLAP